MKTFRFETRSFMPVLAVQLAVIVATGQLHAAEVPKLKVSENGRFLVREDGVPFFWLGDTAWRLAGQSMADVDLYLSDRAEKGFNVIQVEVGGPGRANPKGACPYLPAGVAITIDLSKISGDTVQAHWYKPREGTATQIGRFPNTGHQVFTPPTRGAGHDWVLVLDDAAQGFPPPGSPARGPKRPPPSRL